MMHGITGLNGNQRRQGTPTGSPRRPQADAECAQGIGQPRHGVDRRAERGCAGARSRRFRRSFPAPCRRSSDRPGRGSTSASPSTNTPQDALSATVSWIFIFQSRMRESTISKQAITPSVAASDIGVGDTRAHEVPLEHERDLSLGARLDQHIAGRADRRRCGRPSVGQITEIGLVNVEHGLHRLAGDTDFLADHRLAVGQAPLSMRGRRRTRLRGTCRGSRSVIGATICRSRRAS